MVRGSKHMRVCVWVGGSARASLNKYLKWRRDSWGHCIPLWISKPGRSLGHWRAEGIVGDPASLEPLGEFRGKQCDP